MQLEVSPEIRFYEHARDVAVLAARIAGKKIREAAGTIEPDKIRDKAIHDPVTDTDEDAQQLIVDTILDAFPDHEILAEEGARAEKLNGSAPEYLWIVDPIDGTTNFTRDVPPFAVSIALQHQSELVLGVVLDVGHGDLFTAITGCGLLVNEHRCRVSEMERLEDALITTGFPYRSYDHIDRYLEVLKEFLLRARGVRRTGSAAVDLAWVASGRFDGFFETGLKPWDVAAGIVLVREGGGRVSDYQGNPNPAFEQQIVASNGEIHDSMIQILDPMQEIRD